MKVKIETIKKVNTSVNAVSGDYRAEATVYDGKVWHAVKVYRDKENPDPSLGTYYNENTHPLYFSNSEQIQEVIDLLVEFKEVMKQYEW